MGSCNLLSGNIIEDFVVLEANSLFGVLVSFQYGMGNIAVRYQLDRTVVIGQLFGGNIIRVVSVYRAVDANDALDVTCYRPQVMRHHDDSHAVIERGQYFVQFLFKFVIDKIGRFVQNEQFRVGNQCPTE